MESKIEWWSEEYGFFGNFYHFGDHSIEGYDASKKVTFLQRTENEVNSIIRLLQPNKNAKILDCPCGSGRHSVALSQRGFDVTGVDINLEMLSFKHDYNLTEEAENLKLLQMDMRNLNFPDDHYDNIINMYISFGFFSDEENIKVASEFYRVLKPGGKLLIHLDLNYDNVINGSFNGMEHLSRTCIYNGRKKTLEIDERYNSATKRLEGEWRLVNGDKQVKKYSLRIYDNEKEFIPLFKNVGFRNVQLLDPKTNLTITRNSVDTILIAQK